MKPQACSENLSTRIVSVMGSHCSTRTLSTGPIRSEIIFSDSGSVLASLTRINSTKISGRSLPYGIHKTVNQNLPYAHIKYQNTILDIQELQLCCYTAKGDHFLMVENWTLNIVLRHNPNPTRKDKMSHKLEN